MIRFMIHLLFMIDLLFMLSRVHTKPVGAAADPFHQPPRHRGQTLNAHNAHRVHKARVWTAHRKKQDAPQNTWGAFGIGEACKGREFLAALMLKRAYR